MRPVCLVFSEHMPKRSHSEDYVQTGQTLSCCAHWLYSLFCHFVAQMQEGWVHDHFDLIKQNIYQTISSALMRIRENYGIKYTQAISRREIWLKPGF